VVVLFAAVSAPYVTYLSVQKGEFTINGQGIYTFYSAEGWVYDLPGDTEEAGYQQAIKKYGTPEENGFSIARAILRNPSAFGDRVERNLDLLTQRFSSKELFPMALIPFVVIGLAFSSPSSAYRSSPTWRTRRTPATSRTLSHPRPS
jgi:hypothetical protein